MTPLHIAIKKGINDVVVTLLDAGADVHAKYDEEVLLWRHFLIVTALKSPHSHLVSQELS